jgi:CRISPR-associated protein Cas2
LSLTIVITRDVEDRYRGFIGSLMLEVAPGVYVSPKLSKATRERMIAVVSNWYSALSRGSITVIWRASDKTGGIGLMTFGEPPKDIADVDGLFLMRRRLRPDQTIRA